MLEYKQKPYEISIKEPQKVLILGSGGLSIGQAGEFDYSGSQVWPLLCVRQYIFERKLGASFPIEKHRFTQGDMSNFAKLRNSSAMFTSCLVLDALVVLL